jgi:hypothetical protein
MSDFLGPRQEFLRGAQNADGGWGYFPGKQSWLEPTAYALMALHDDPGSQRHAERGWALVRSWQRPDGSWRPCAAVDEPHWTTALAVTLHCMRGVHDAAFHRGVDWLLNTSGVENRFLFRLAHFLRPGAVEMDPSFRAWPWRPGTASWVEPTAHTLVALKKVSLVLQPSGLRERINAGERMILDRRCSDGGWNYGNRKVMGEDLPSYPETTALALLGLAGSRGVDLKPQLALAQKLWSESRSPLAKSWLTVALRRYSIRVPLEAAPPAPDDVLIQALDAIGASGALA